MQGEHGVGVHHCGAGRILADLTCCAFSLAQGLKPPTCPACWSSLRSLKVRIWHGIPRRAPSMPCWPPRAVRAPCVRVVVVVGGLCCCCLWAPVTLPRCLVLGLSLPPSPWDVETPGGPHGNQRGGEESLKERGCATPIFRELGFGCCETPSELFLGCFVAPVLQPHLFHLSPTCSLFSQEGGNSCTAP